MMMTTMTSREIGTETSPMLTTATRERFQTDLEGPTTGLADRTVCSLTLVLSE